MDINSGKTVNTICFLCCSLFATKSSIYVQENYDKSIVHISLRICFFVERIIQHLWHYF